MRKKWFMSIIILLLIIIFTNLLPNIAGLLSGEYFIPKESTVFTFKATEMNHGSGDWWLYGEDNRYYYGLNIEPDYVPRYFKQQKGKEPPGFNKTDYKTWQPEN